MIELGLKIFAWGYGSASYSFSNFLSLIVIMSRRQFASYPLSANPTKWSNTLKQFVGNLSVFDHFVKLMLKGLTVSIRDLFEYKKRKYLASSNEIAIFRSSHENISETNMTSHFRDGNNCYLYHKETSFFAWRNQTFDNLQLK